MKEKVLKGTGKGLFMLIVCLLTIVGGTGIIFYGAMEEFPATVILGFISVISGFLLIAGIKAVRPQEAVVYTLFGKYIGTGW